MRIVRIEVARIGMRLSQSYTIAYETVSSATNVFVQIVTDTVHVGLGCGAPDAPVTGETVDRCERALRELDAVLVGQDALARTRCLALAAPHLVDAPAARAAVDQALHDLLGKASGLPVATLLGGHRRSMPTSVTLGIDEPGQIAMAAVAMVAQGFRALKIKGGRDVDRDVHAVHAVRAAVGPDIELRFDANQGYAVDDAIRFVERTRLVGLELIEQPTPADALPALGRVTRAVHLPVMADESVLGLSDAWHVAARELCDMLNIKLMKVGGLDAALSAVAVGRAAGLEVMIGCMDESALAIAAGLHLALARPAVVYADLDGHLDLVDDPAAVAVRRVGGSLWPLDGPGFGLPRLSCFE